MRSHVRAALAGFALLSLVSCTGLIYTNITTPLVTNMRNTPVGNTSKESDFKHLQVYDLALEWDSNAIGDTAKKHGLKTIYYADLRTVSVLGGLWRQQYAIVVGE